MKREDFMKIIRLRSVWKINKKKGNYKLPNGEFLSDYIRNLVDTQMTIDNLGVRTNGDLCSSSGGTWNEELKYFNNYTLTPVFENSEICTYDEMEKRINLLVRELIH